MRLLNIHTQEFGQFSDDNLPPYIITSHRWTTDEASFKDVRKRRNVGSKGYYKIQNFCTFATGNNGNNLIRWLPGPRCDWIWIDTCCIDKDSSAEVSESINSVCSWYGGATFCLAHLADVPELGSQQSLEQQFPQSVWFKRGWTLQELLAPSCVIFLTRAFAPIAHKCSLARHVCPGCRLELPAINGIIATIAGVPESILSNFELCRSYSVEERMRWTANRKTTKPEDMSYCLLGIFDVHMPLIYGEGARNARKRLEEEISKAGPQKLQQTPQGWDPVSFSKNHFNESFTRSADSMDWEPVTNGSTTAKPVETWTGSKANDPLLQSGDYVGQTYWSALSDERAALRKGLNEDGDQDQDHAIRLPVMNKAAPGGFPTKGAYGGFPTKGGGYYN